MQLSGTRGNREQNTRHRRTQGSFKNYVNKVRWVGDQNLSIFVNIQGEVSTSRWVLRLSKKDKMIST